MELDPTATHLPVLEQLFHNHPIKTVLEFGCGLFSTKLFVEHGCYVTSFEMQSVTWYHNVKKDLPSVNLILALGKDKWESFIPALEDRYDLIFVDGHKDSRPDCMMWAKDHTDLIVAHDTEHSYYQWERADMTGFKATLHDELTPTTTVWERI